MEIRFSLILIHIPNSCPLVYLHHFPLFLYLIWVTSPQSYLGSAAQHIFKQTVSVLRLLLSWPLSLGSPFPFVDQSNTFMTRADILLGPYQHEPLLEDLRKFFHIEVCKIHGPWSFKFSRFFKRFSHCNSLLNFPISF